MSDTYRFGIEMPKGYRIYYHEFQVAGTGYRKDALSSVIKKGSVTFELMPEPENEHDRNAIKVQAIRKRFLFGDKIEHIGYVPKELAADIAKLESRFVLLPRPKTLWIGDRGGVTLTMDILGNKKQFKEFEQTVNE